MDHSDTSLRAHATAVAGKGRIDRPKRSDSAGIKQHVRSQATQDLAKNRSAGSAVLRPRLSIKLMRSFYSHFTAVLCATPSLNCPKTFRTALILLEI
jgi:hypothetical protein